ncbi:hypothetical protein ACFL5V_10295 [Fibrobacterota bacterium]
MKALLAFPDTASPFPRLRMTASLALWLFAVSGFGIDLDRVSINGFTSIEVEKQLDEVGPGDPNYSIDADLFDLLLNFQIGERMRATVDLAWEHGAETNRSYGSTNLEYAFIEHTILDEIKVRIGKILTPFGIFNEIHRAKPAYLSVNVPVSTTSPGAFAPLGFSFFPRAGVGLSLQGETTFDYGKTLAYNLSIANGMQDSASNPYERDGNKSKSVTVRVRFDVMENMRVGKSFYVDNPADSDPRIAFSDGYEMEYSLGNFRLLSEFVIGHQFRDGTDTTESQSQQRGFYAQPSYAFDLGLIPYLRFEFVDPDTRNDKDFSMAFITGVHYEISKWYMIKLETDYFHFGSRSRVAPVAGFGYTEVKMSLVLGF